ncbi:unnamed protein product [Colias eurytheme]|nr:unnamed protein product [Colias eurytheme]
MSSVNKPNKVKPRSWVECANFSLAKSNNRATVKVWITMLAVNFNYEEIPVERLFSVSRCSWLELSKAPGFLVKTKNPRINIMHTED